WNPKGYFEHRELVRLNKLIIKDAGLEEYALIAQPIYHTRYEGEMLSWFNKTFQGREKVVLKDPRFCFTFPVWSKVLSEHSLFCVTVWRHSLRHARSLFCRGGAPTGICLKLYEKYCGSRYSLIDEYVQKFPSLRLKHGELIMSAGVAALASFVGFRGDIASLWWDVCDIGLRSR
ncbi:MAG: hypothetical protein DRP85_08635, partial [Candidatus Makaraimicrobium thalassicum]